MQAQSNHTQQGNIKTLAVSDELYTQLERIAANNRTSVNEQSERVLSEYVALHPVNLVPPEKLAGSLHTDKSFSDAEIKQAVDDAMTQDYLRSISASE